MNVYFRLVKIEWQPSSTNTCKIRLDLALRGDVKTEEGCDTANAAVTSDVVAAAKILLEMKTGQPVGEVKREELASSWLPANQLQED